MRDSLYSPVNRRLALRLKAARLDRGMTQVELAAATERTQAYISKFEAGQLRLDVADFLLFTRCLGLDPHQVLDELMTSEAA